MKRFISLVLVLLMITTMLPLGMMAIAETAPSWVIEDFENISDCSITGLNGQITETVNGFSAVIGTSTGAGFSKSITPAISITDYEKDYLALKLKFYIEDPTVMNTVGAPQIELTSSGKCDVNELHWSFSTLSLKAGWNDLLLNFSDGVATGGMLDITNINYIRIYTFFTAETKAGFGPMEIVTTHGGADFDGSFAIVKDGMSTPPQSVEAWVHPNNYGANEWMISDFDGTDEIPVTDSCGGNTKTYTTDGGASVLSCDVPAGEWISLRHESMPSTAGIALPSGYGMKDLALSVRVYIEDVTAILEANVEIANTRADTDEISWDLNALNAVKPLQNGWNELVLPFNSYSKMSGEFTVSKIKWWRFNFDNTADGASVYKLDYIKIVPLRADNSLMIVDFNGNESLAITDSCGSNTKVYTTEDNASILHCTTADGEWISLKQEGLPNTAGIILPEDKTMEELALSVRVYIEDVSAIVAANVEIANTNMDTDEIAWDLDALNAVQPLKNGWNELVLPFNSHSKMNGEFTVSQIKWWRFNFDNTNDGANIYKMDYIKIVPVEVEMSTMINDFDNTSSIEITDSCSNNTKTYETIDGATVLTCDVPAGQWISLRQEALPETSGIALPNGYGMNELALSVRVYIEDVTAILAANVEIANTRGDTDEISWDLDALNAVQPLKNGWNELVLPFNSHSKMDGEFTVSQIKWWRFNFDNTEDGTNIYKMDYIKIVPMEVEMSTMINDFDNTSSIEITDSCSNNTKTYETIDGATVLTCDVPAGQWISLRQEALPETSGIALPNGYGMNELALSVRVYIEDVTAILVANVEIANTNMDTDEISWDLDALNAVQPLKNGWNELVLPFNSHSKMNGEFTVSQIKWWRFNFDNTEDGANIYKMDYIKIVPMEVEMSTMINDFDNTSSIEITDSCSNNTKTYETIDGATVLTCDVPAAQWISLRQETLPETSGIALPSGYGMNELALSVRVYIEDVTAILAANVEIANTRGDTDEISWDLDALNAVQPLKNGWNELVLPFNSHSKMDGEFTVSQIKWWRFNFDNTEDGANVYMLDYLKIVPLVQKEEPSTDTSDQERNYLFSYTDTSGKSQGLFVDNEGLLYWLDGDKTVNTGAYLTPNEWSHVAYTLDPATKTLIVYMNGQATSNFTLTADLPTEGTFRIGAGPDGFDGGVFSGKIGDVRVWTDIRTETEIANNYQILINTATEGLYANWRLNEDMGFVAAVPQDKVGANHASVLWRDWSGDWIPYEEPENYDYTFVAVPDPQILAASYPDVYYKLFQYIADNAESQKIEYVLGLGDITNSNSEAEWAVARKAFDYIEGKVPYANVLGNHDYGDWTQPYRDTTRYNNYFKYADHAARSDWGGAYEEGKLDNVYYCFNVGNVPYMVVCLEFLPRDGVITWANQVVAAHPDRNVIVLTHGYIDGASGNIDSEPQSDYGFIINNPDPYNGGQKIWQKFISQHENIIMSMCGHTFCEDDNVIMRTDAGVNGNTVVQLCLNAQTMDESYFDKTGVGMLGLLRFSENGQKVALQYYSPHTQMCFREVNQLSLDLPNVITISDDQIAAKAVQDQIDALNVQSLDDKPAVIAARTAYDELTDAQKDLVTNLQKLVDAEAKIDALQAQADQEAIDKAAAKAVQDRINALNVQSLDDKPAVVAARTAYDELTDAQKDLVTNLQKLVDAEAKIDALQAQADQEAIDKAAAKAVQDQIDALNVQSLDDKPAVVAARTAYDELTDAQKDLVTNLQKLVDAETKIDALQAQADQEAIDKAAAKAVQDQIAALNVQSLDDKPAVVAARTAYDELTDAQKDLVTNLQKLTDAEVKIEQLENPAPAITYGDVDGNGKVDASDALEVLKSAVGKVTLTDEQFVKADTDGNGKANAIDALNILKKVVGKIDKFPVEL